MSNSESSTWILLTNDMTPFFVTPPNQMVLSRSRLRIQGKRRCRHPKTSMKDLSLPTESSLSRRSILHMLPIVFSVPLFAFADTVNDNITTLSDEPSLPLSKAQSLAIADSGEQMDERLVSDIDPLTDEPLVTDLVFVDLAISKQASSRIVIGLYGNLMPRVVENFKKLAEDGYADTSVYRIVPGLTIQLGDVLHNSGKIGRAAIGEDGSFEPDNFRVKHTIPGIVSMVRRPDGSVDSRFFIATREGDSMYLDGRYAGFGRVVEGLNVLKQVEKAGEGFIRKPVRIVGSGILK